MTHLLNIPRSMRLSREARAREDWVEEYHYGMAAIAGGMVWGALLSVPAFILGCLVFAR